ncbi:hypothetical protein LPJ78_004787 [Coemansia sp. RSA 989]|nr:Fms-interacting protein-domain-containing protein [Coemansia mojavensis]KAJ1738191.1 hypothetical protein LPJ68_005759 [Coemansia sp. RSA 1086]KAJ1748188.1 hypothetical protein LPJ79_004715 [Coemansia sp. RSA 1821]KAJ1862321.1 hypothetical protein LPJ78_004787 [Coemansia sp. RSA 989]KAJ1870132.1 hypothetical protein LPJ55_004874 [Coemansia sp. RSA 990]KAJ2632140.1 hypothetical protein H4R22_001471 [Coemansia sp. RSA 1290]KAJ2646271.1 hypothetical protein IWW40_005547 [Coemansia sp. RSA 125
MDIDTEPAATPMGKTAAEIRLLCDRIEQIATVQLDELRANGGTRQQLVLEVTSIFARLRILHRQLNEDKAELAASVDRLKRDTDGLALQLENRQREVQYIEGEIESTKTLETIYQDIDLVPEAEFLETAPPEFQTDIDTPHKLMLARLRYEIHQRDLLMTEAARARARRDELRAAKRKRIERLEKIDGHLNGYIKSVKLLGRSLGASRAHEEAAADAAPEDQKESKQHRPSRSNSRIGTPRV